MVGDACLQAVTIIAVITKAKDIPILLVKMKKYGSDHGQMPTSWAHVSWVTSQVLHHPTESEFVIQQLLRTVHVMARHTLIHQLMG